MLICSAHDTHLGGVDCCIALAFGEVINADYFTCA